MRYDSFFFKCVFSLKGHRCQDVLLLVDSVNLPKSCLIKTPSSTAIDSNRRLFQLVNQYRLLIMLKLTSESPARRTNWTDRSAPAASTSSSASTLLAVLLHLFTASKLHAHPWPQSKGPRECFVTGLPRSPKHRGLTRAGGREEEEEVCSSSLSLSPTEAHNTTQHKAHTVYKTCTHTCTFPPDL